MVTWSEISNISTIKSIRVQPAQKPRLFRSRLTGYMVAVERFDGQRVKPGNIRVTFWIPNGGYWRAVFPLELLQEITEAEFKANFNNQDDALIAIEGI